MDAVRAGRLRRCDDLVDAQVAVACGPGTDLHDLVGHGGERRTSVGLGDDGNRLHPEAAGGLDDANGDFAAIGDQDFLQHGRLSLWHPGGAGGNRSVYTPLAFPYDALLHSSPTPMLSMHVLARGDVLQRLRLITGLVLFTFVATHFLNHALGLVSLDAMEAMQGWRKAVTRSWPGTIVLLSAFVIHILLALYKLSLRLTWRLPFWEAAQIASGFSIPLFLITHAVFNRGAASLAGTDDSYAFELANIWPGLALEHAALLVCVWVHGCIGMHYWLSLAPWYRSVRQILLALAVALPVTALAGFSVAGRQVEAQLAAPGAADKLRTETRAPDAATEARLVMLRDRLQHTFLALLGLALLVPVVRIVRRAAGARVEVTYRGGPTVRVAPGPTLLEISRMKDVPHASVCGGRARCSTCRVGSRERAGEPAASGCSRGHDAHGRSTRPPTCASPARSVPCTPSRSRGWWPRPRGLSARCRHRRICRAWSAHSPSCSSTRGVSPPSARRACPTTSYSFSTACSPRWARPSAATTARSTSIWATA